MPTIILGVGVLCFAYFIGLNMPGADQRVTVAEGIRTLATVAAITGGVAVAAWLWRRFRRWRAASR